MLKYYLWNIGCQMNKAESERFSARLESLGYGPVPAPNDADLVLLNTCVVRGNAEEKVRGEISYLKGIKSRRPQMAIAVTGCFVESEPEKMRERFPHVDLFFPAGEFEIFEEWMSGKAPALNSSILFRGPGTVAPAVQVPIIRGCNNFCSYCIVPFRRGRERSRVPVEIAAEVQALVERGAKEVTLLGQNVNSYGRDLEDVTGLSGLLSEINGIPGLERIRFLTSHPRDVDRQFALALSYLTKVCEWINLPVQAGDDRVLQAMRRGYTVEHYRNLVGELRSSVPGIAISTDVIVGFPGETDIEFTHTMDLLSEMRFDTVHVATYSPRPGTLAALTMPDDIPAEEKSRRLQAVEALQEGIASELNQGLIGRTLEVMVERRSKGKWEGRTRTNRLVFVNEDADLIRQLVKVEITSASPWSLQGKMALKTEVAAR